MLDLILRAMGKHYRAELGRHRKGRRKGRGMALWDSADLCSLLSCPHPLPQVPAHSDAGEVHGRHCQWHGVSEYQEIHTPGPGCQELHVSVKVSRDPRLLWRLLPSFSGWKRRPDTHTPLRQVRTQDWDREVSKMVEEGFLGEVGP